MGTTECGGMPDAAMKEPTVTTSEKPHRSTPSEIRAIFDGANRTIAMAIDDRSYRQRSIAMQQTNAVRLHAWISTAMPRRSVHRSLKPLPARRPTVPLQCVKWQIHREEPAAIAPLGIFRVRFWAVLWIRIAEPSCQSFYEVGRQVSGC